VIAWTANATTIQISGRVIAHQKGEALDVSRLQTAFLIPIVHNPDEESEMLQIFQPSREDQQSRVFGGIGMRLVVLPRRSLIE
jgi:hypothetical protein